SRLINSDNPHRDLRVDPAAQRIRFNVVLQHNGQLTNGLPIGYGEFTKSSGVIRDLFVVGAVGVLQQAPSLPPLPGPGGSVFRLRASGSISVLSSTGDAAAPTGYDGQVVTLLANGTSTLVSGSNLVIAGGLFPPAPDSASTITLMFDAATGIWREL